MQFNLADLFDSVAETVPARTALVCGEIRLDYAALSERVNRLAQHFLARGVRPGDNVGILLHNTCEHVETMLASFAVRAVPVSINVRYLRDELAYLCMDAAPTLLVHGAAFEGLVDDALSTVSPAPQRLVAGAHGGGDGRGYESGDIADYEEALARESPGGDFGPRSADDHYILYTGGTTGSPKGVVWRHEDIFFAALSAGRSGGPVADPREVAERARSGGVIVSLPLCPLSHASGQWATLGSLLAGGQLVLYPDAHLRADAAWRLVERERVNVVTLIGDAAATPMVEELERGAYDTSSVLALASGGSIFSSGLKGRLHRLIPAAVVVDAFGSSETGSQGMTVTDKEGAADDELRFTVDDATAVFAEDGTRVAPGSGAVGRVARQGHIPLGYHNDPVKTEATFLTAEERRWICPGDMATVDPTGRIVLLGRGALCINTGGEKVFPEEVEAVLKSHPGVADAVVIGVPDPRWGERVAAVIQPLGDPPPSDDELVSHCRDRLAGYKAPRRFLHVDKVERNIAGKPDYGWARGLAGGAASGFTDRQRDTQRSPDEEA